MKPRRDSSRTKIDVKNEDKKHGLDDLLFSEVPAGRMCVRVSVHVRMFECVRMRRGSACAHVSTCYVCMYGCLCVHDKRPPRRMKSTNPPHLIWGLMGTSVDPAFGSKALRVRRIHSQGVHEPPPTCIFRIPP